MMEVIKKNKKLKRRRYRSGHDSRRKDILEATKILSREKNKIVEDLDRPCTEASIISKNNKLMQTESSDYYGIQCLDTIDLSEFKNLERSEIINEKDEQIKGLTDRLQQVTNKLYESKNSYLTLKQDFNKAQKLLCSEVGENVSVASLSNQQQGGGWRGRAEQIQQLQQKISELQLKNPKGTGPRMKSLDRRSSSSIRNLDKERKQQLENLSREMKETEAVLEKTKKKLEASKARVAALENDLVMSKKTIGLLNEKTTHDNQLLTAMQDQVKVNEAKFEARELDTKKQNEKMEREIVLLKCELEASQIHRTNFQRQLDERDKEIESLRSETIGSRRAAESRRGNAQPESPTQSPGISARDANEYVAIGIAAEAERERLLELVTVLNRRLDKERNDFEQLSELLKKERIRGAKLEAKLQKLELERVVLSKVSTGSYKSRAPKGQYGSNGGPNDPEELRLKYELLQEECLTLKTRLATIQKDKCADLVLFKKILNQTRAIFNDAIREKFLPNAAISSFDI